MSPFINRLYVFSSAVEFRSLLYDVMRQVINGSLEADEVVAAFSELASTLVSANVPCACACSP